MAAGANRHAFKLTRATLARLPIARPAPPAAHPHGLCLDKGSDFDAVREVLAAFGDPAPIRPRGEAAPVSTREAGYKARRWVGERTQRWMNRLRRMLVRWAKQAEFGRREGTATKSPPRARKGWV